MTKVTQLLQGPNPQPSPEKKAPPNPKPETPKETASKGMYSSDHLKLIPVDDGPGTGFDPGPGTPGDPPKAASARLSKEEFYGTFKFMFAVPNMVPVAPFPLKALPIQPGEEDQARAASDVIYDIAAETPHLRWLIEPGSEWMQRLLVIGTFAMGKGMAVMAELNARQAPRPEPAPRADAPKETPKEKPAHGDATTVTKIAA